MRFFLLISSLLVTSLAAGRDSTYSISAVAGTASYDFINFVSVPAAADPTQKNYFGSNSTTPLQPYCIGIKGAIPVSEKNNLAATLLYSNFYMRYSYTNYDRKAMHDGHIRMRGILSAWTYQHRALKWVKLNLGLFHYINFQDHFDNDSIARDVNWYGGNGKSKASRYVMGLTYGLSFKIYKRVHAELAIMSSFYQIVDFYFNTYPDNKGHGRIRGISLTLNYRIVN